MRAVQIQRFGGPEVLELTDLEPPNANAGEVLIKVALAGVNFADTHRRSGSYIGGAELPFVPGSEVAGVREDTGERVIAFCGAGGYAEYAAAREALVFAVPPAVEDATALALLVQGCTAWHLYRTAATPRQGDSVVVHSATGGTGSLALQLGRAFGAGRMIATASTEEKLPVALGLGADAAILGAAEGLTERILAANDGRPVDLILDPSGGEVFKASRAALAPFGRIVAYGLSSGEPNDLRTSDLLRTSHTVAGFWLTQALERPQMLAQAIGDLFERVRAGTLQVQLGGTYPLERASQAHADLAARRTTGKLVLDVTNEGGV
jgi:NADPH2:quinone reductase